jgi:hypothetical protein
MIQLSMQKKMNVRQDISQVTADVFVSYKNINQEMKKKKKKKKLENLLYNTRTDH